nr:MAG TPA: hypothetical protein [Crassvirales sp.]
MTIEEYKQKQEVLKKADKLTNIIILCKLLDGYKDKRDLNITLKVNSNKENVFPWKTWSLKDYDEDLLLDIMSAIKKYQARLEEKLSLL